MPYTTDKVLLLEEKELRTGNIFFMLCLVFVAGLFFSRALVSTVPALLFLFALTRGHLQHRFRLLIQNRFTLGMLALYLLLVLSILYTEDLHNWSRQLYRYSAFLFLPAAIGLLPPLREKQVYALLYFFLLLTTGITLGTILQYAANIEAQNELIVHSQNPPTINHIFHIQFGVMMALSIFFGLEIYRSPVRLWKKAEKQIALACIAFIFISIHILAYRTGLLALYITLFTGIFSYIKYQKRYLAGGALLLLLLAAPVIAYVSLESVRLRVENTRKDFVRYSEQRDINYYSISMRLAAWETAFTIVRQNWLVGVGPADIKLEMQRQYQRKDFGLKKENQVMIHNQYLHVLVGSGIIGLLLFLLVLYYPLRQLTWPKDFCAASFLLIMGSAMLVDSFFELQRGINLFVFFYMLFIARQRQLDVAGDNHFSQER